MTDPMALIPWYDGPLATLDTETTGTDVENDRIVTGVVDVYETNGNQLATTSVLINPGIDIPEASTLVHGITNEQAQADGEDPEIAVLRLVDAMETAWADDLPIVIYNAAFDLTIIDRELRRHAGMNLTIGGPIIDPMVIDRQVDRYVKGAGQRQLGPTCARYGVEIENWHTASADAFAAQALARAMARKYDAVMPSNMGDLWRWQRTLRRDQAQSLQDHFARIGKTNDDGSHIVINGEWPMQQFTG